LLMDSINYMHTAGLTIWLGNMKCILLCLSSVFCCL